jgi:hypothetical protein
MPLPEGVVWLGSDVMPVGSIDATGFGATPPGGLLDQLALVVSP